jgi:hypothetical protein
MNPYGKLFIAVVAGDQNAGRYHNIKADKSSFKKDGRVHKLWNNLNKYKFHSGRN